ncbi:thiosulfate sulfurtransferase GlpE [Dysgonomonas sp. ZJ279]|uniref:thiosulfate sulfurtransferase GlpE n=1 Tax=Dysgonomonas sp. ZJ279 TaxID=2709796 RepID=UPI0013ECD531|nr:thiosulfate sulfurtransferase GlpE [Dysgonomonas sp. ZJ279]
MNVFKRISAAKAKEMLNDDNVVIVDVRDSESYKEGHASSAIHLSQDSIFDFIQKTDFSQPVLVMCYHGNSSQSVAMYLSQQGFQEVYSIDGGYEAWGE